MRKSKPKKRVLLPDPKFNDTLVTQFVNNLMFDGKNPFFTAFSILQWIRLTIKPRKKASLLLKCGKRHSKTSLPTVEVKSRRVGGATFQVPTEIRPERKVSYSMKNLILFARKRSGKSMADKLAAEIVAAYNQEGGAYKKKEDMHKMAEANRAFAHFRF
jgi:small subunit ribosomal protein S7